MEQKKKKTKEDLNNLLTNKIYQKIDNNDLSLNVLLDVYKIINNGIAINSNDKNLTFGERVMNLSKYSEKRNKKD